MSTLWSINRHIHKHNVTMFLMNQYSGSQLKAGVLVLADSFVDGII